MKKKLFKTGTVAFFHLKGLNHEAYEKFQPVEENEDSLASICVFLIQTVGTLSIDTDRDDDDELGRESTGTRTWFTAGKF